MQLKKSFLFNSWKNTIIKQNFSQYPMSMFQVQVPRHWQRCCKDLCEQRWGLLHAGHSQLQSASADPLWGTAELLSHTGDTSRKSGLRKYKILHKQWGSSEKINLRNSPVSTKGKKSGRKCSRCCSRDSPAVHVEDHGEAGCPYATHRRLQWIRWKCPEERWSPWRSHAKAGSHIIFSSCSAEESVWESGWVGVCQPCKSAKYSQFSFYVKPQKYCKTMRNILSPADIPN